MTPSVGGASFRPVKTPIILCAALVCALSACTGGGEQAGEAGGNVPTPPVLVGVPVLQGSQLVDTVATGEAARAVLLVAVSPDSVTAFYRRLLPAEGWRIVGDVRSDSGGVDLYAERDGPPLWIQVRRGGTPDSTRYVLIGAVRAAGLRGDTVR